MTDSTWEAWRQAARINEQLAHHVDEADRTRRRGERARAGINGAVVGLLVYIAVLVAWTLA